MLDHAPPRPFLNVASSATGRVWRDRLDEPGRAQALMMTQQLGLSDAVARVLAGRGVAVDDAQAFLDPKIRDLMPEPFTLTAMEAAVDRLARAARADEHVGIFGDYDVDGACSAALLASFLRHHGVRSRLHIPDRITEGYGPNIDAIRAMREAGVTLLVTVDCGTASHEPFAEARALGLDVIALDHHQAPVELPDVLAIVNPNRQDDLSGLGSLCAAGVVFMTLVALNRALRDDGKPFDLISALDLVALATVADVVPLVGLNRAFVRQGLVVMARRERVGLRALADAARLDGPPQSWHLGFLIGPRINAGGRIGDAALGARLLLTEDDVEAARIAAQLDALNRERQAIEAAAVEEGVAQAEKLLATDAAMAALLVGSPDWHPGVVGLVAARLKERFGRPAFAMAWGTESVGTGSGRSIPGVDLGRAVRAAVEAGLLMKGGGHAMAAGVTLGRDRLADFAAHLDNELREFVATASADRTLSIDGALSASGARPALVADIARAGPFGAGNSEPVFALPHHVLVDAAPVGQNGHLRLRLKAADGATIGAVAFRAKDQPLGQALVALRGEPVHIAGTLSIDRWGGGERVELRVIDAAKPQR
ncbi:single-stranded-DNA-specific exonuclease RecJ [Terrirubrum flagellatum]|uniref:single-stranded-DNA-specific exonuclease RecJ n=1 Tax=Terrirubrum flagellatum TaxID=2895980 RepID=UPI003CC82DB3